MQHQLLPTQEPVALDRHRRVQGKVRPLQVPWERLRAGWAVLWSPYLLACFIFSNANTSTAQVNQFEFRRSDVEEELFGEQVPKHVLYVCVSKGQNGSIHNIHYVLNK